jgi:hypothetical protein
MVLKSYFPLIVAGYVVAVGLSFWRRSSSITL